MPRSVLIAIAAVGTGLISHPVVMGQSPGTTIVSAGIEPEAREALAALDRYLETWNSRDGARWATSLHFPHVRPGPGAFELSETAEAYAANVDFTRTLATGWHHSEWTSREVVHVSPDKVHVAGAWRRYTEDDRPLVGSAITYIVTREAGRWGVLSRFAAGPTGVDPAIASANAQAALRATSAYFAALNEHEPNGLAAVLHYPHVRVGDGHVELSANETEFMAGSDPGRVRTWFETRMDDARIVQVSASGANVAVTYSRRNREGTVLSQYEAVMLAVERGGAWRIQAVSTMGP